MEARTHEETAEPAAATPALAPAGVVPAALTGPGASRAARVLTLQRAIGNQATGRLLQRQPATAARPKPPAAAPDFTPFIPTRDIDTLFRVGAETVKAPGWNVEHIAVIDGSVYVAKADGRRIGNYALKGGFGLEPGAYVIDHTGTRQFGYRGGKLTLRTVGWRNEDLPEDIRKLSDAREQELKREGKTGPTIFLGDFIDLTQAQEEAFTNVLLFVRERTATDPGGGAGRPGPVAGGDKPPKEGELKPPALAEPGHGAEFGHESGKRADLPAFPAQIRPMSSMRGGTTEPPAEGAHDVLPFVYQPVRGAAVYTMAIDYTSAAPGQLLFQAAAAGVRHGYRWELWDITESHDAAIAEAARTATRRRPGDGGRTIGPTEAAHQDIEIATDDLARRQQQYAEDQRRAAAEGRYFDALAGEVNRELFGLEGGFRYGKELLGLASDAMDIGRERRVPIPREGIYVLRCIARWDPYAEREGRPWRAPSVASLIIKVKPREWLSRDALSDEEAGLADLALETAIIRARIRQAKAAGADITALEAQLAEAERKLASRTSRARDQPVAMLERQLQETRTQLAVAQKGSSLFQAGYGRFDAQIDQLTKEVKRLDEQLGHARDQLTGLRSGDPDRVVHRLTSTLVSRVTGQTYPLLLHANDPKQEADGKWSCRLADATSRSGHYYAGRGTSAILALRNAVEALAGDQINGFGEGSLSVRAPAAGAWKDLDETTRTLTMDTRHRDWAAARERLDELATVLGLLALVAVPGAGEAAMVLGAALAAARLIERKRNDALFWDAELVSDIIAVASAAAVGTATVGKLRIVRKGERFAIVAAEQGSRIEQLSRLAQRANDWFLDPANIAWGNVTLLVQLKEINDQLLAGGLTATEARRQKATLMANAINTNLALVGKMTGAGHEADGAAEQGRPKRKAAEPEPEPRPSQADAPPKRVPGEERTPPVPEDRGAPVVHEPAPQTPRPAADEPPPRVAFRAALETGGAPPVAEARRVILEARDWKGSLRRLVAELPQPLRARAMEALAEARQRIVREITDAAAQAFGADQRNWGTPGFGSDIDLTITPRERMPGFAGPERPVADQIRAAADAAEFIAGRLREVLGAEPDLALDTNVYSYIAEDRVALDTPDLRARASALEAEVGLAEARRGVDPATWQALEQAITGRLGGADPMSRQALADLRARLQAGIATERALVAEMERTQAMLRDRGVPADQLAVRARDAILTAKKRQLADLWAAPQPDMIRILRLQAEIRWFAPDAYASGAAFEYTVGFGQARRSAGADAAAAAGRDAPTQADVLADLAASWARERGRPEEQRMALYAAAATAQLGMLGAHAHGAPPDRVKAAAKYAARILDLLNFARMGGTEGIVPTALANFVQGRWPQATDAMRVEMLVRFATDVGMEGGIVRDARGQPTGVTEAVMMRFVAEAQAWALDATARLMVGERLHHGAVPDPPAPPPPAGGLRGATYDLRNEYTYKDASGAERKAGGLERALGGEKVSKAMAGLRRLDADATVKAVVKKGLDFVVSVPDPANPKATIDVAVNVVIKPTDKLTPSEHGEEGGPARLIPSSSTDAAGTRTWRATIEVDSRLAENDLPHVLRHETNEMIGLVRLNPGGGEPAGGWGAQMRPGVMLQGGAEGAPPTVHDRAAVLELKALHDARDAMDPASADFAARSDNIERLRESMGLDEPSNLRAKLRMLREAGLPAAEIRRLAQAAGAELGAAHRQAEAAAGRTSVFDDALTTKTLIPRDLGDFKGKGLNGGHVTQHLLDLCAASVFHVREVATPRDAGGTRWRRFEQWRFNGPLADKPTDPAKLPGGADFEPGRWTRSDQPKTTADDAAAFLREADSAWRWWFARHNGEPGSIDDAAVSGAERAVGGPSGNETARSDGGVEFAGFFDPVVGGATVLTLFPDESWLP